MKEYSKRICKIVLVFILVLWVLNQGLPYRRLNSCKAQLTDKVASSEETTTGPDGYSRMNGLCHTSLSEQSTCATNAFAVGTKVSIWCGIDAEHGSSIEATVVSNQVHVDMVDTIEFSEDINDFFAGGTTTYAVWVKEV